MVVDDDIDSSDEDDEEKICRSLFIHFRFLVGAKPSCENERDCSGDDDDREDFCLHDGVFSPFAQPPIGDVAILLCCNDNVVDGGLNKLDVDEGDENASIT